METLRIAAPLRTVVLTVGTALIAACGGGGGGSSGSSAAAGIVQLSAGVYEAAEGSILNIRVSRTGNSAGSASVDYSTTAGSALSDSDYAAVSGTLTWANNVSGNQTISIRISDDAAAEPAESFTVTLSNPTNASLGVNASATVTIIDDDPVSLSAFGPITSLGSATVNGVRYETNAATVTINGQPGDAADLELGQLVRVQGVANLSTGLGTADAVSYSASVIGPVEHVDSAEHRLLVLGQTIVTTADTVYGQGIDPDTLDGLALGATVEISGSANHLGEIVATRMELDRSAPQVQLIGTVDGLDLLNGLFSVNRLVVDFGSATTVDLAGGLPVDGRRVMVRGVLLDEVLMVETIADVHDFMVMPGERFQFSGRVTRFVSALDFEINGFPASTGAGTEFVNGAASELQLDADISVRGEMAADADTLLVDELVFGAPTSPRSTSRFDFEGFTNVSVAGLATVAVRQGPAFSVEVTADRAADLVATQDGATVVLGGAGTRMVHALVTMPVLASIDVQPGSIANVTLSGFDQLQMAVSLDGVSALYGEGLMISQLSADVAGVSFLDLGNGRPVASARVDISGVSSATLNMEIGANLTGSIRTGQGTGVSTLFYYGTDVDVSVASDAESRILRLGDTRDPQ